MKIQWHKLNHLPTDTSFCINQPLYTIHNCTFVGVITQGPSNVTYFPGDPNITLTCTVTSGIPAWKVNETTVLLSQFDDPANNPDVPPGHSRMGTDIIIEVPPANNTRYVCLVVVSINESHQSDQAFVYVAGE